MRTSLGLGLAAAAAVAMLSPAPPYTIEYQRGTDYWPWDPTPGHRPVWKKRVKRAADPAKKAARKRQRKARAITRRGK